MTDCPRIGKLFGGCRFSPRYDVIPPGNADWRGDAAGIVAAIEAQTKRLYVGDVCKRCGRQVKRGSTPTQGTEE